MTEIPCRFVADFEATRKLVGGDPLLGFGHEVDSQEPFPERKMGIMEDRPGRDGELIPALIAVVLIAGLYMGYLIRSTTRAFNTVRPSKGCKVLAASLFVAIIFNEIDQICFHRSLHEKA
jgi:hypothetical protein